MIHMSYEGGGMKLGDLARSSHNPTSFMPAFRVFLSRFGNRETAWRSRNSYESVPRLPSVLPLFTLRQQTTMVIVLGIFRRPRHPGYPATFLIWTHCEDRNFCPRACRQPASSLYFLSLQQNQSNVYREVLVAGDLSKEDIGRAFEQLREYEVSWL